MYDETQNYNDRLKYLTSEVNKVTYTESSKTILSNINYKYVIIISLPIVIAIILIITKPGFITVKSKNDKDEEDVMKDRYVRIVILMFVLYIIEFLIKFFVIDKNVL